MYLFCYGSLMKNNFNHHYLEGSEYLGDYFTDRGYALFVAGLPYMVKRKGGGGVQGELYKISPETLKSLDVLEGHPTFYKREEISVYDFESGNEVKAYAYIHPDVFFGDYPWKYEQRRKF